MHFIDGRLLVAEAGRSISHELRAALVSKAKLLATRKRAIEVIRRLLDQLIRVAAFLNGLRPLLMLHSVGRAAPAALGRLITEFPQVHTARVFSALWHLLRYRTRGKILLPLVMRADRRCGVVRRARHSLHHVAGILSRQLGRCLLSTAESLQTVCAFRDDDAARAVVKILLAKGVAELLLRGPRVHRVPTLPELQWLHSLGLVCRLSCLWRHADA